MPQAALAASCAFSSARLSTRGTGTMWRRRKRPTSVIVHEKDAVGVHALREQQPVTHLAPMLRGGVRERSGRSVKQGAIDQVEIGVYMVK